MYSLDYTNNLGKIIVLLIYFDILLIMHYSSRLLIFFLRAEAYDLFAWVLFLYSDLDPDLARIVLKKVTSHSDYLGEDLVCLSLFNDEVDNATKRKIVAKLIKPPKKLAHKLSDTGK